MKPSFVCRMAVPTVCLLAVAMVTGLLAFCQAHHLPLRTFPAEVLAAAEGDFTPSDFVKSVTGVDNVCERAAVCAGGRVIVPKLAKNGVTVAVARKETL